MSEPFENMLKSMWAQYLVSTGESQKVLTRKLANCIPRLINELELARTQVQCDLITGEPGHQKLLCDKLQAELEAAQKELAIKNKMIEAMAIDLYRKDIFDHGGSVKSIIGFYRTQAEREGKGI